MDYNDQLRANHLTKMVPPSEWLERDIDFLETAFADDPVELAKLQALKKLNFGSEPYVKPVVEAELEPEPVAEPEAPVAEIPAY